MLVDGCDKFLDADLLVCYDLVDGRTPVFHHAVQIEHHVDLAHELVRAVEICLVDGEHVADLQDTRLDGLDVIAHAGNQYDHRRIGCPNDVDLGLPDADGLDKDNVLAKSVHRLDGVRRLVRKAAQAAACPHAADEYAFVHRQTRHADAVTQDGAARKRAGRVDGDDADGLALLAVFIRELVRQRALASARRPRNAEHIGVTRMRVERLHDVDGIFRLVLDRRDGSRKREAISLQEFLGYIHGMHHLCHLSGKSRKTQNQFCFPKFRTRYG